MDKCLGYNSSPSAENQSKEMSFVTLSRCRYGHRWICFSFKSLPENA